MSVTGKTNHPENQTEQKAHQENLDAQRSLAKENAELKQQLIKLEEREQANAEMLATVSHEIRTPIGAIMTMVELLQTTDLNTNQHHYAQTLQLAAKNLSTLTTDILNFARLEAGHVELEEETFNLKEFLGTLTSSIKQRATDKGLSFICELDENCPQIIKGDQVRLSQVINNLANNALKFTEKGALKLTVSSSGIKEEKAGEKVHLLRVELKDTGIGISKAEQEKIFTPFCQANSSIQAKFGGSGLGLYISKNLAERMGGELDYKSQKECGSTFWFTFLSEEVTDQNEEMAEDEANEGEHLIKAHALIVEDNPLNQMLIKTYLDQFGVTYDCVANGQLALNIMKKEMGCQSGLKQKYDLILMDIMMPVMDGITATKELHKMWASQTSQNSVSILALTANALDDQVEEYYKAGVDGYVSKPIRGVDLYDAIEALLQNADVKKAASA